MRNQGSTCNDCNGGYFCPLGASEEIKCNKGHYCPAGSSTETKCPIGTFRGAKGYASCHN